MLNNKVIRFYLSCSALHYISLKRCNHSIIKMAIPLNTDVCSFDIFMFQITRMLVCLLTTARTHHKKVPQHPRALPPRRSR